MNGHDKTEAEIVAEANELERMIVEHIAGGAYHGRDARLLTTALLAAAARVALSFGIPVEMYFQLLAGAQVGYVNGVVRSVRTPANE